MALGSTTFTAVTWTAGDTITETKMDNMQANTQAYDAHASEGVLLNNNVGYYAKNASGSANVQLINLDTNDQIGFYDGNHLLTSDGKFLLNESANSNMTVGVTVYEDGTNDEVIALKSSAVTHGITDSTETDTYGVLKRASSGSGGITLSGYSEATVANIISGVGVTDNTTKTTGGRGYVELKGYKKSGTDQGAAGADANLVVIRNATTTRFIFDAEGDSHQDVGTAWTNFDDHEDIELLTALSAGVSKEGDPIKKAFGKLLEDNRETLEENGLVTFNEDGHHFINWSRTNMLVIGAVRQMADKMNEMAEKLQLQDAELKLLKGE